MLVKTGLAIPGKGTRMRSPGRGHGKKGALNAQARPFNTTARGCVRAFDRHGAGSLLLAVAAALVLILALGRAAWGQTSTRSTGQLGSSVEDDGSIVTTRSTGQNTTRIEGEGPDGEDVNVYVAWLGGEPWCGGVAWYDTDGESHEFKVCNEGEDIQVDVSDYSILYECLGEVY